MHASRALALYGEGRLPECTDGRLSAGPIDLAAFLAQPHVKEAVKQALHRCHNAPTPHGIHCRNRAHAGLHVVWNTNEEAPKMKRRRSPPPNLEASMADRNSPYRFPRRNLQRDTIVNDFRVGATRRKARLGVKEQAGGSSGESRCAIKDEVLEEALIPSGMEPDRSSGEGADARNCHAMLLSHVIHVSPDSRKVGLTPLKCSTCSLQAFTSTLLNMC